MNAILMSQVMIMSILPAILMCEWSLLKTQEATMITVAFSGILIGSPVLGKMADTFGRKVMIQFSIAWALYFGILSGLSPGFIWLLVGTTFVCYEK